MFTREHAKIKLKIKGLTDRVAAPALGVTQPERGRPGLCPHREPAPALDATHPHLSEELDIQFGHARPWLKLGEVARVLRISGDHVSHLFDSGALDCVIDVKARSARRPYYRIFRGSFARYQSGASAATNLEQALEPYLRTRPPVLLSNQIADFLSVSHDLVLDHTGEFFNAAPPGAHNRLFRATQAQLLQFIKNHLVSI
jgi:hypothetical protein